jgi:hypothetical protein
MYKLSWSKYLSTYSPVFDSTQALIKCPLFLITFDLIYPTFIFYLYYLFFKKLDKWEWSILRAVVAMIVVVGFITTYAISSYHH